jgi:hypothetical protein
LIIRSFVAPEEKTLWLKRESRRRRERCRERNERRREKKVPGRSFWKLLFFLLFSCVLFRVTVVKKVWLLLEEKKSGHLPFLLSLSLSLSLSSISVFARRDVNYTKNIHAYWPTFF